MGIIDNINHSLGNNLKQTIMLGVHPNIAAYCFLIYAYGKNQL